MSPRTYAAIGAITGWFAVFGQLYLSVSVRAIPLYELLLRFIGFFTITTNTLVALCFTFHWLGGSSRAARFFTRAGTVFALAVFISLVGLVYNIVLRALWQPQGFQVLIDELLHSVQPLLFLLFWAAFVPKEKLTLKGFLPWLVYPLVYILYVIVLGAFTMHYPYPFADAGKLGYPRALLNGAGMMLAFLLFAWLLLAAARLVRRPAVRF